MIRNIANAQPNTNFGRTAIITRDGLKLRTLTPERELIKLDQLANNLTSGGFSLRKIMTLGGEDPGFTKFVGKNGDRVEISNSGTTIKFTQKGEDVSEVTTKDDGNQHAFIKISAILSGLMKKIDSN